MSTHNENEPAHTAEYWMEVATRRGQELALVCAQLTSAEAELAAPITEEALRRRNGGALPVGEGCEVAVRGTTKRAEAAETRVKEIQGECDRLAKREAELTFEREKANARLRAVTEALNKIASWGEGETVDSSFDEPHAASIAREALQDARSGDLPKWSNSGMTERIHASGIEDSGDLPPHPDTELALKVGWRAGVTCSANVCTKHSDDLNADDTDLALVRLASELGKRVAGWIEPGPVTMEELLGMFNAARAQAGKEAGK